MNRPEKYIALFGRRNAGKTVFLAALYGAGQTDGDKESTFHVAASDDANDPTHHYLRRQSDRLHNQEWPDATVFENLKELQLVATVGGDGYVLRLPDVAGEVVQRNDGNAEFETARQELKEEILRRFQDYHGFIVVLPADAPGGNEAIEVKWEIDALIQALQERAPDGGKIRRPVALIVSKWDIYSPHPEDVDTEQKEAVKWLQREHSPVYKALEAVCENFKVYPVSATGALADNRPDNMIQPFGLQEPVGWILETSDRVLVEGAERYLDESDGEGESSDHEFARIKGHFANPLFQKDDRDPDKRTRWQIALARFNAVEQQIPPRGELANRVRQGIKRLNSHWWKRRVAWIVTPLVFLLIGVGAGSFSWDYSVYAKAERQLEDPSIKPAVAIENVDRLLRSRIHWIGKKLWGDELRDQRDARFANWEYSEYQRITALEIPEKEVVANAVAQECSSFCHRFPKSRHLAEIQQIQSRCERIIRESDAKHAYGAITMQFQEYEKRPSPELRSGILDRVNAFVAEHRSSSFISEIQKIRSQLKSDQIAAAANESYQKLIALLGDEEEPQARYLACSDWLADNAESPHAGKVEQHREEYLVAADNQAWNSIRSYVRTYETRNADIAQQLSDYLNDPLWEIHDAEAKKIQKSNWYRWDRRLYENIRDLADNDLTGTTLDIIHSRCQNYLNKQRPILEMESAVLRWVDWYNGLKEERQIWVDVSGVWLKKSCRWYGTAYWPDVSVGLMIGDKQRRTGSHEVGFDKMYRGFPNRRVGPFSWKWGDPVAVTIKCTDWSDDTLRYPVNPKQDGFTLRCLNEHVPFDDARIWVYLECAAAEPPALPTYGEN